jgi:hypothetical protein
MDIREFNEERWPTVPQGQRFAPTEKALITYTECACRARMSYRMKILRHSGTFPEV